MDISENGFRDSNNELEQFIKLADDILDEEEKIYEYRKRGAYFRIRDFSWWDLELPIEEEIQNGISNLEKVNYKVDYVISHCCPTSIQTLINPTYKRDVLTDYLQQISEYLCPESGCSQPAGRYAIPESRACQRRRAGNHGSVPGAGGRFPGVTILSTGRISPGLFAKRYCSHAPFAKPPLRGSPLLCSSFLLIDWRSLRTFMQADFHASMKSAHKNVRVNCNKSTFIARWSYFAKFDLQTCCCELSEQ